MGRVLAIDYGGKRSGIAVTDPLQLIATGLVTVYSKDLIPFLNDYLQKEEVETIVVGEPKQMDGSASSASKMIAGFVKHLGRKFPTIHIDRMDERFTSRMAFQSLIDGGAKKKERRNKALIDKISATLILQSWMEQKAYGK